MENADELRKRLKDEREFKRTNDPTGEFARGSNIITVSSTSGDIEQYSPDIGSQDQRDERFVPGLHHGVRRSIGTTGDTKRKLANLAGSLAQINQRERPANRRSSENNGQNWSDGVDLSAGSPGRTSREKLRKVGNLETAEIVPPRDFNSETETANEIGENKAPTPTRRRGRPPKRRDNDVVFDSSPISEVKSAGSTPIFSGSSKVLSTKEAAELKEPLVAALQTEFELIDKILLGYTEDPLQQPIWGDVTEKELESLTNIMLKMGQKSPTAALITRTAVDGSDYVNTAILFAPRFQSSVRVVKEARLRKQEAKRNDPNNSRQSVIGRIRANRHNVDRETL